MQKAGAKGFSFLAIIFLIASVLMRFFMLMFNLPSGISLVLYALVGFAIIFSALSVKGLNDLKNAFSIKHNSRVSAMGFVASVGFFVDFVHQCVAIFKAIDTERYRNLIQFIPICFICLFALVSCFYFFCVSVSLRNDSYDFRLLKMLHIAPLLWSICYVLTIMSVVIKPLKEPDSMIKYATLILLVCFLYFLAVEIEGSKSSNKIMLIFAKAFSILSFVYFVDRALAVIINHSSAISDDNIFSITLLTLCFFAFSFEREIVKISNLSKGV